MKFLSLQNRKSMKLSLNKYILTIAAMVAMLSSCTEQRAKDHDRDAAWQVYQPTVQQQKEIDRLISQMTIEEKAIQLASYYPNNIERLDIPNLQAGECLHGITNSDSVTSYPQAIALGSTWDPELVERVASAIALEARTIGVHHCYSPNLGLARDPRWGRFEECYSEDPELVSQIGKAYVIGLQGIGEERFSANKIIATGKHFIADGRPQSGANGAAEELSPRIIHELYLKPYKVAIQEAHLGAIMPAHHTLNGYPCHASEWLLQDILRDEFGFDGIVVSDNGDIKAMKDNFRFADTYEECAAASLSLGVNTELAWLCTWNSGRRMYGPTLIESVKSGLIPEQTLDKAVAKILQHKLILDIGNERGLDSTKAALLMQENIITDYASSATNVSMAIPREDNYLEILGDQKHNDLALEAALKAMTLLKNDDSILPLSSDKLKSIALIGPNADEVNILGTYSTKAPRYFVTVKQGLENLVGDKVKINYQKGISIESSERSGISSAVRAARESDVAVVVLGDNHKTIRENEDRDDIALPGLQNELLEAIVATGKPVVLVLIHGRTPDLQWADKNVTAILSGWFMGQECGNAVAQTLFGLNNPGGKTPVTYPRGVGILPQCYNDLAPGRKHKIYKGNTSPLYPFGYGLSYTTFDYGEPKLSSERLGSIDDKVYIEVDITNSGDVAGDEVVQMYIRDDVSSLARPMMELKDFKRVSLDPGETESVSFEISRKDLEFWKEGEWIVENGSFTIMIGRSSADTQSVTLTY